MPPIYELDGSRKESNMRTRNYGAAITILTAIIATTTARPALQTIDAAQSKPSVQQPGGSRPAQPELRRQSTPRAVVDEHLDALNKGDWHRLMSQYPLNVEIFLPGGALIRGRDQVGEAFRVLVKPFNDGGLLGIMFTAEHVFTVGDTVNVQWRAEADFLTEPYRGADAYVTKDGLLAAQVSTFDMAELRSRAR